MYFCTLRPSIGPKERWRQAFDRLPLVSKFLTNFWMQHFDGARLSPNSVRNAVWHALNEPVCQYLRTRNPRYSTVYIDNSLGPLVRDSPCISSLEKFFYARLKPYRNQYREIKPKSNKQHTRVCRFQKFRTFRKGPFNKNARPMAP